MPIDELGLVERLRTYAESGFATEHKTDCVEAAAAIERLLAENRALTEALTPSGGTKAAYIGEFSFNVEVWDPEGGEDGEGEAAMKEETVPWTTVKEIMAAISARARQALEDKP